MPSIANRALLLNLGLFTADNNIRRNTGTFTHNFQCGQNNLANVSQLIQPAATWTFTSSNTLSVFTLVETTGQVQADTTLGVVPVVANKVSRAAPTTEMRIINQVAVIDDSVTSIVFTNPGLEPVRVTVVQG